MTPSWTTRNTLFIFLWFFAVYRLGKILLNTFENVSKPKAMKHLGRGWDIKDENVNTENDRKDENHGNATVVFFLGCRNPNIQETETVIIYFILLWKLSFKKLSFVTFLKKIFKTTPTRQNENIENGRICRRPNMHQLFKHTQYKTIIKNVFHVTNAFHVIDMGKGDYSKIIVL